MLPCGGEGKGREGKGREGKGRGGEGREGKQDKACINTEGKKGALYVTLKTPSIGQNEVSLKKYNKRKR